MRIFTKRTFSFVLVLALCVSLLSGLTFQASAATVDYVYGADAEISSNYPSIIKNWGERGTAATFLSPNAEAFYADNNVTYESLSAFSGTSNVDSVPSSALYSELNALVTNNQKKTTSYDDTRYMFQFTDCQGSGSINNGQISSFYSGTLIGPAWDGGDTWNREHTWPNSKGNENGSGENDIMMLRPTAKSENGSRGNKAYGESTGYYFPNTESNGEYDVRGDVARIMLYVYTRWGTVNMWGSAGVIESKEVLLDWMEADPVDTWEMGRNDSVESITGTRNVYVDYPELAFLLFDEDVPTDMQTPSGKANGTAVSYTVTAVSNNTSYGTVSLSGTKITATPNTGYYVAGYTVTSGTASVTRDGNVFTVIPSSNCTVQINFAESNTDTDETVQFVSNNVKYDDCMKLMYAVYNPNGEEYTIELQAEGETYGVVKVAEDVEINGQKCTTYVSQYGVPLQNMETVVTATVSVDGVVQDTLEYSVLEYLHEMQTKVGGGLKTVSTEAKKSAMLNMYASLLRSATKIQNTLYGSSTIGNYGYVYVENGTYNNEQGTLLESGATIDEALLDANEGTASSWQYKIVGSENDFADLPANLEVGNNNIILKAKADESGEGSGTTRVSKFVKVTSEAGLTSGDKYLIVYEDGGVAFDGSLTTLDAENNTIAVTIEDNKIAVSDELKAATFTVTDTYVKSASGYYIGQTSNANGLKSGTTGYDNSISINDDGTVNIVSGEAYLRFNAASNQNRFRYYKSSTYTGQKAICLYKLVEE